MRWEPAPDLHARMCRIVRALEFRHVDPARVHCLRVYGARANAWARIWGLPPVFQHALGLPATYVVEFLSPGFDSLPSEEQDRVIIHELLHIPTTFSGGVRPERSRSLRIDRRTVERYYRRYRQLVAPVLEDP
jgi:predicted metallopeptidase